ncbi:MAG: caspase family protein [Candidatus Competibacter sp.]
MAENRSALIVAVSEYQDAGLRQLVAPAQDAEALARVLGDPAIGGFAVKTLLNQPSYQVNREIEAFFANRVKNDLLLFYFSGHGLKDEDRTSCTLPRPTPTAIIFGFYCGFGGLAAQIDE